MSGGPAIDADRVLADLRELARRTGDDGGAQRVCWTETWREARAFLGELLAEIGLEHEQDEAGNLWARLEGRDAAAPALALGSHIDSVPDGGWLDGALGVLAALGVLRAWAASGERPPRSLALVDWADEEGARFGRSLFGSSAFSGTLDPEVVRALRDGEGDAIADVLAAHGVELARARDAGARAGSLSAYLELHIEQGPVLEQAGLAVAAVAGCAGVERGLLRFRGQAAHAGTTPMPSRHDAGLAAAETALAIERIGTESGGVATTGTLALRPGIATAVPGIAELGFDLRHRDAEALAGMHAAMREGARAVADARECALTEEAIWRIEPLPFDSALVAIAAEEAAAAGGPAEPLTSGALHDAAEVSRRIPSAMVFCPSKAGLSHAAEEDTAEADLRVAIEVFGRVAGRVLSGES